ncbi:sugar phosphate isomerase/epimerase [Novosphingobium chloroacetimidivorans]|uniref:Sugar phosphate isomerase/epimerase n=1 Tax=Novosphingobium chloroacetimidivorans TaxID=1428314 RepID=A0A7W7KCT8_9SPHN|nr:TIM barrel protein [Novosphingobium chloroacetimidivorans]MBB4860086.1 sugar phosphate isomerase/epimerase [Novosphingobium chloroacetimidivorans]
MHPRVSLHEVAFIAEGTRAFAEHAGRIGVRNLTLATGPLLSLGPPAVAAILAGTGTRAAALNHVFAVHPDLPQDRGEAARQLTAAIDAAARLGADRIYLISGGRGVLSWEAAAERFAELIAPCADHARQNGVTLLVENASPLNVDIHLAHTLPDAIRLAEIAGIGVCIELHACWMEGALDANLARAMPLTGLVQVSDYVLGDRVSPCRAVPGDGAIPLERLLGTVLELGYEGLFDLELVGPRITAEGPVSATTRAAEYLSELLTRLGA